MKIAQASLCHVVSVVFICTKWKLDLHFKGYRLPTLSSLLADKSPRMETWTILLVRSGCRLPDSVSYSLKYQHMTSKGMN